MLENHERQERWCSNLKNKHAMLYELPVKGETKHDEYIAHAVSHALQDIMLSHGVPIGFGVITPNTLAQAKARSRGDANKGCEAAIAALTMAGVN